MKNTKQFLMIGLLVSLVISCTTSAGVVFDDTIPLEETAWVNTNNVGMVTAYNGIPVNWKSTMTKAIQIPAGDTLLEFDLRLTIGSTTYTGRGILFQYNYQPQKQYFFMGAREEGIVGLNVYSYNFGEKPWTLSQKEFDKHFIAFVPFLNAGGSGGKTVLE